MHKLVFQKIKIKTVKYVIILVIFGILSGLSYSEEAVVKIHYLGHSAFVLQFDNGTNIVTDYGHYNAWVDWGWDSPIHNMGELIPDVMTYSHTNHEDHFDPDRIPEGVSHILTEYLTLEIDGIHIKPIRTCEESIYAESNSSYIFLRNMMICPDGYSNSYTSRRRSFPPAARNS